MEKAKDGLVGRVVVITGAANGIGLGIAEAFSDGGSLVYMLDINEEKLAKESLRLNRSGGKTFPIKCDVLQEVEVNSIVKQINRQHQKIDVLVNNAGMQYVSLIEDFPVEIFNRMIQLMLVAPFVLTKAVFPIMKHQKRGRIINIASINGHVGFAGKSAYNSAKHGLIGLTKVAALEGATFGITVNALCPGYVDTDLVRGQLADIAQTRGIPEDKILDEVIFPLVPQKRLIDISEIASMVTYLAGSEASSLTGQSIIIDGGYTIQ